MSGDTIIEKGLVGKLGKSDYKTIDSSNEGKHQEPQNKECSRTDDPNVPLLNGACNISPFELLILQGEMMGNAAAFLIDSGSASNIISKKFLSKRNIDPQPSDHDIIYPNDTKQNADQIPCQKFKIDKYEDELDSFVVDTQSKKFDVILGKPWLEQYNPMINWKTHCVFFTQNGKCITLSPESARSVDLCTAQFKRAVKNRLDRLDRLISVRLNLREL